MQGVVPRRARAGLLAGLALCLVPLATDARAEAPPPPAASSVAAVAVAAAPAETVTLQGSLNAGDLLQSGRVTRDGITHGCETPTAMPVLDDNAARRRDSHVLQNTHDTTRCIVVEADLTGCAGNQTMVVAYSTFNQANPGVNVLGASGFSTIGTMTFGFRAAPNSSYTLVVHELDFNAGCPLYKLKVTSTPMADVTTSTVGANGFAIAPAVTDFRGSLGPSADRREITWDDVPESLADPQPLPADYFNTTQPRGLVFTSPADVRVSSDGSGATAPDFGDHGATNEARYQWFSPVRMMSPIGDEVAEVAFRVAGTPTPAPTSAFAAVIASADGASYLLPRDAAGEPLGIYAAPPQVNGLTFLGLRYSTPQIHSMSLAADWVQGVNQGSVFDNLIYADPGFHVNVTAAGPGRVTAPGLDCPGDCTGAYGGEPVTLTAVPSEPARVRWTGACVGNLTTCVLSPTQAKTAVTATFTSCATQEAAITKAKKVVKKRKKAVRKAQRALSGADRPAEVAQAKSALAKATKKLKKAKKKQKKAQKAFEACLR